MTLRKPTRNDKHMYVDLYFTCLKDVCCPPRHIYYFGQPHYLRNDSKGTYLKTHTHSPLLCVRVYVCVYMCTHLPSISLPYQSHSFHHHKP